MDPLVHLLQDFYARYLPMDPSPYHTLTVLGCSGGRDSMLLLHMLARLQELEKRPVLVVYVHHALREEADEEALFVAREARRLGFPFRLCRINVKERVLKQGESLETASRNLRYAALENAGAEALLQPALFTQAGFAAPNAYVLFTAHHANDQAETMLMHLLRGCGLKGLTGMQPVSGNRFRPFLTLTREQINEKIQSEAIAYREDESNQDPSFSRNWVRRQLIAPMEERYPGVTGRISALCQELSEEEDLLNREALAGLERCRTEHRLSAALLSEPPALQKRILRLFLEEESSLIDVERTHIEALLQLLRKRSGEAWLPGGRLFCCRGGMLFLSAATDKNAGQTDPACPFSVQAQAEVYFPADGCFHDTPWGQICAKKTRISAFFDHEISNLKYTKWISCGIIKDTLCLRTRRPKDRIGVGCGHQTIKKYMISRRIPSEQRDQMPILFSNETCLWIIGDRLSSDAYVQKGEEEAYQVVFRPDNGKGKGNA